MSNRQELVPYEKDSELVSRVSKHIDDQCGYDPLMSWDSSIPMELKVAQFTYVVNGFAFCEGYVAFLMMDCYHQALPICLQQLGLPDLASLVETMLSPIPVTALGDEDALVAHFGTWEDFAHWVEQFEETLFENNHKIVISIATYMRTHASCFAKLGAEVRQLLNNV